VNFRAFSGLNLSEDQRTQIRSIVKNALEEGTPYESVESQITSVLTPSQQAQLTQQQAAVSGSSTSASGSTNTSVASLGSSTSSLSSSSVTATGNYQLSQFGPPPGPPPGQRPSGPPPSGGGSSIGLSSTSTTATAAYNSPFSALNLTTSQSSAIANIFASVGNTSTSGTNNSSSTSSSESIQDQINQVLTTAQQETLSAEFNTGFNQSQNIQDQIAASTVLNVNQLQYELGS